jgi:rSAM/selenodomain-associated transferase 1
MVKCPRAGRVKRRLAARIGDVAATQFYRHCLANTLLRVGCDPRWRTLLAVSPDGALNAPFWPAGIPRLPQGAGDLGSRMQRLFRSVPPGPALIIGSDIPAIDADEIARAFRLLDHADAVFGPAHDGGYWLIGLRRSPRLSAPFADVRWSGPQALADTLRNLAGRRVAFVKTLSDVDTEDDYRAARGSWQRLIPPR